jgi:RNA polymerase sigma factor (sigma-70 family)
VGAVQADDHRAVLVALRALPVRQREVLVLRYYLDCSEAEIATTLGIGAGTVKTHARRGLAALAETLEERR